MPNLFFMRIPKTGGSTLHEAFLSLELEQYWGEYWPASARGERLPTDTFCATFLRNPLERVLSHYNYLHTAPMKITPVSGWIKGASFRQWLDSDYSRRAASNLMTRFFCDGKEDNLNRALETMAQFDAVGILRHPRLGYQHVINRVCIHLGCPVPVVGGHYHIDCKDIWLADLSPDEYEEIIRRNSKDMALVREAERL